MDMTMLNLLRFYCLFACVCMISIGASASGQTVPASVFFVANEGQWQGEFAYRYDGGGGSWFITREGLTIDLRQYEKAKHLDPFDRDPFGDREPENRLMKGHVLKVNLVNANPDAEMQATDKLSSYSNYFLGRDSTKWRSRVGHYQKVTAKEVWPGIDVEYLAKPEGVEMVFRVQPGADISKIQVEYEGLDAPLSVDGRGNLVLNTSLGSLTEKAPFAYQIESRRQSEVPVHYELSGNSYHFIVDRHDNNRELVIDPLIYSSFFGGDETDGFYDSDLDADENLIMVGVTSSTNLPVTPGAYQDERHSWGDVMIAKFDASGQILLFCTYLGGNGSDHVNCCKATSNGTICMAGYIESSFADTWPLTINAIDTIFGGGTEAFLSCMSEDGTELFFSSYFGGNSDDAFRDMDKDSENNIYLTGYSRISGFPTTPDALYEDTLGAVVLKFDPIDFSLLYSTMIPGEREAHGDKISVITEGEVWISGGSLGGGCH
jgi:hypothetical protein